MLADNVGDIAGIVWEKAAILDQSWEASLALLARVERLNIFGRFYMAAILYVAPAMLRAAVGHAADLASRGNYFEKKGPLELDLFPPRLQERWFTHPAQLRGGMRHRKRALSGQSDAPRSSARRNTCEGIHKAGKSKALELR